jgi:hypothetical protein
MKFRGGRNDEETKFNGTEQGSLPLLGRNRTSSRLRIVQAGSSNGVNTPWSNGVNNIPSGTPNFSEEANKRVIPVLKKSQRLPVECL